MISIRKRLNLMKAIDFAGGFMGQIKITVCIAITCLAIAGCNFQAGQSKLNLTSPTDPSRTSIASFESIKSNILDPKCLRCHAAGGDGGVDLSSYNSIKDNPGLVTAGDLKNSRLYTEVATGSMPEGGPVLNPDEIAVIENWILAGASDGDTSVNPPPINPPPPTNSETIYSQIQTKIFNTSCVRCHSSAKPSGKVDLSDYQKLMANKRSVIVPGKPQSSLAYTEIIGGSMPPKGKAVDPQLVELFKNWITNGARETE